MLPVLCVFILWNMSEHEVTCQVSQFDLCVSIIDCVTFPPQILESFAPAWIILRNSLLWTLLLCSPSQRTAASNFLFSPPVSVKAVLTSCCIQRGSHVISKPMTVSLCAGLLLIAASLRLPAECSFLSRRRGFIDGRRAPRWADGVRENEMSPRRSLTGFQQELPFEQMQPLNKLQFLFCMLCIPECTCAPTSREEPLWNNPTFSLFCLFEAWETEVLIYICSMLEELQRFKYMLKSVSKAQKVKQHTYHIVQTEEKMVKRSYRWTRSQKLFFYVFFIVMKKDGW